MRRGIVEFSLELFVDLLDLPEDFHFLDVKYDSEYNTIKVYGVSEEYLDMAEGNCSPIVKSIF